MKLSLNQRYLPIVQSNKRYHIIMGGRAGGRSYFASQYALARLVSPQYFRCAIMRFVLSDIRNSIYQEIVDRIEEEELQNKINIKDLDISYGDNSIKGIGFRKSSSDQKSKLKSLASFNCVIIEEADEVTEEDFLQLDDSLRSIKGDIKIILLLNPPHKNHWIVQRWFNLVDSGVEGFYRPELKESEKESTVAIHSTYLDNAINLNKSTKENFEKYRTTKPDHYYNMIKGLVSEGARGRIFKNWKPVTDKEFEELPYTSFIGLDFGFTNDPTAIVEIKQHNDTVWLRELLYETGLINTAISRRMSELGISKEKEIYADSAEPKSIQEIALEGWNIKPAVKGADSVRAGIDMLLGKDVHYTESSTNLAKEIQEYKWALDRNKEPTNEPVDEFNHVIDATRYGIFTKSKQAYVGF